MKWHDRWISLWLPLSKSMENWVVNSFSRTAEPIFDFLCFHLILSKAFLFHDLKLWKIWIIHALISLLQCTSLQYHSNNWYTQKGKIWQLDLKSIFSSIMTKIWYCKKFALWSKSNSQALKFMYLSQSMRTVTITKEQLVKCNYLREIPNI